MHAGNKPACLPACTPVYYRRYHEIAFNKTYLLSLRSAGRESCLMLHTECSWCPKPKTSGRRAGCIIAAANGQSSRGSPRRRWPVVGRISAQVKLRRVDTGADRREVERGSTRENGKPSGSVVWLRIASKWTRSGHETYIVERKKSVHSYEESSLPAKTKR